MKKKIRILAECAIMVALATVLSFVKLYAAPLGGSVTLFSMVPIIIIGLRYGLGWGLGSAFVYSGIQLLFDLSYFSYVPTVKGIILCLFFDYIIAFTMLGLSGIFRIKENELNNKKKMTFKAIAATVVACLSRFACHYIAGVVVWYEITKEGDWNELVHKVGMYTYSFIYNISYLGPDMLLDLIAVPAVVTVISIVAKNHRKNAV